MLTGQFDFGLLFGHGLLWSIETCHFLLFYHRESSYFVVFFWGISLVFVV